MSIVALNTNASVVCSLCVIIYRYQLLRLNPRESHSKSPSLATYLFLFILVGTCLWPRVLSSQLKRTICLHAISFLGICLCAPVVRIPRDLEGGIKKWLQQHPDDPCALLVHAETFHSQRGVQWMLLQLTRVLQALHGDDLYPHLLLHMMHRASKHDASCTAAVLG